MFQRLLLFSFIFVDFLMLVICLLYISVAFVGRVPLFKHLFLCARH